MSSVSNVATGVTLWSANSVDEFGHLTSESFGNGVTTTHNYDAVRGVLNGRQSRSNGTLIQDWAYGYDVIGNMTFRHDKVAGYKEQFMLAGMDGKYGIPMIHWLKPTITTKLVISLSNPMWVLISTPI